MHNTQCKTAHDHEPVPYKQPVGLRTAGQYPASTANLRVTATPIVLETNICGSKDVRYELDVPSGGYDEVHVKANIFQPKLTVWR